MTKRTARCLTVKGLAKELIQLMQRGREYDDMPVVMSQDEEGNAFHPLLGIDSESYYDPRCHEIANADDSEGIASLGPKKQRAVVLWPM